jgi:DNA-binding HxlR family transcriptional regulator
MALGEGPLRTKDLTERVPGYAPRTVYRYAGKLAKLEVIKREEEPGVPSKVIHTLTAPCGAHLYELVNRFANSSLAWLPDGRIDAHAWASLGLLADLWEAGMVEDLSCGGKSPTELARGPHGLSYHQVNRRAGLFKTGGLLGEGQGSGRRRCYELTEKTRRRMGLTASIARWRHHHVVGEGEEGMTASEMATLLRAGFPLVKVPEHKGKCLQLGIRAEKGRGDAGGETVWAMVEADGTVRPCASAPSLTDGWGRGEVKSWISVVLDGESRQVLVGADARLVGDCLGGLYNALWAPNPF